MTKKPFTYHESLIFFIRNAIRSFSNSIFSSHLSWNFSFVHYFTFLFVQNVSPVFETKLLKVFFVSLAPLTETCLSLSTHKQKDIKRFPFFRQFLLLEIKYDITSFISVVVVVVTLSTRERIKNCYWILSRCKTFHFSCSNFFTIFPFTYKHPHTHSKHTHTLHTLQTYTNTHTYTRTHTHAHTNTHTQYTILGLFRIYIFFCWQKKEGE